MDPKVEKDLEVAKQILKDEFQTLVEDGQLIGMRNMRIAFMQWAQKMNKEHGTMQFSPEQVDHFMSTYVEELEKTLQKQRSNE